MSDDEEEEEESLRDGTEPLRDGVDVVSVDREAAALDRFRLTGGGCGGASRADVEPGPAPDNLSDSGSMPMPGGPLFCWL